MTDRYDLVIIGGGIAGSALAATMAAAGRSVLVLEASAVFEDRVRGEWIAPWGVVEVRRLGLYERLLAAGGHHVARHATFDESLDPGEVVELPLAMFIPGVPGPLCLGHPPHCQTLFDTAGAAGATMLREVEVQGVTLGSAPWARSQRRTP